MLRRKVTGSASFVCLRCRLQLAGSSAAGAGAGAGAVAVARRSPFTSTSSVSAYAALTVPALARRYRRHYSTSSAEASKPESPTENKAKAPPTTDPAASEAAPEKASERENAASRQVPTEDSVFDWDLAEARSSGRARTTESDDKFRRVFEASQLLETTTGVNSFDYDWKATQPSEAEPLDTEGSTEEATEENVGGTENLGYSIRRTPSGPLGARGHSARNIIMYTSIEDKPKMWSTRSGLVTAQAEGIDMEFLGGPASAIVLRQKVTKEFAPIRPLILPEMDAQDMTKATIDEDELLANRGMMGAASEEETLLHIHELQPNTRVLPDSDFVALRRTLVEGFTKVQLEMYIQHWKMASEFRNSAAGEKASQPQWVLEHRPWVPAVEDAVENVESKLYGYITNGMTPKERLAVQLMRLCWELSSRELYDQPGYLDVKLRDVEFKLLALGGKLWMKRITRLLLSPGMQIEMFRQSQWISIRAPKHAAHWILDNINQVLECTVSAQFSKDYVCPGPLTIDPPTWEKLSTMTGSVARLDPTGKRVLVTWVQVDEPDGSVEDPGEHVLRLLSYAYRPEPRASSALRIIPPPLGQGGRYLPEVDCEKKLPWQERTKKWTRWTGPAIATSADSQPSESINIPLDFLPFPIERVKSRAEYILGQRRRGWSPDPYLDTSATFGHVLFEHEQAGGGIMPSTPPSRLTPRSFVARLPCIRNLSMKPNLKETGLWHTVTVMRFVPAPDLPDELLAHAPPLELRIDANHREIKRINDLRAITHTFTGDIAFPNFLVDVRMHQNRYYIIDGADIEEFAPAILSFLEESQINPMMGRFATPPSLNGMRLPRRFFTGQALTEGGPNDTIEIDYMFAGVELQRHVSAEYQGLKIHYTNIAGGWRRGRRSELSLDAYLVNDIQASHQAFSSLDDERGADGLDKKGTGMKLDMSPVLGVADTIKQLMDSDAPRRAEEDRVSGAETQAAMKGLTEARFFKSVEDLVTGKGDIEWLGADRQEEPRT